MSVVTPGVVYVVSRPPGPEPDSPQAKPALDPAKNRADSTHAIDEIVVKARRRDELPQEVPISITPFDSAMLRQRNVFSIDEVGDHAANVKLDTHTDPTSARIYIRGVGPGPGPRVGLYVDGVYWGRDRGSIFSMMDLEGVEVLRGPQGVSFGRNTTGGAVLVHTQKPVNERTALLKFGYGNRNLATLEGVLNYALTEALFARLAIQSRYSDGYVENVRTGASHWDENNQSLRASVRYLPTSTMDVALTAHRRRQREHGPLFTCAWVGDADPRFPTSEFHGLMVEQGILDDYRESCRRSAELAPRRGESQVRNRWDLDSWGTDSRIDWDLGGAQLRSLTAWRRVEWAGGDDADAAGFVLSESSPGERSRVKIDALTQELVLSGSLLRERLDWLAGAYWLDERISSAYAVHQPFAFSPIPAAVRAEPGGAPARVDDAVPDMDWDEVNRSLSYFGEVIFHVNDRLALSAGVRRIHERKQLSEPAFCFPPSLLYARDLEVSSEAATYIGAIECLSGRSWAAERYDGWTPRVAATFHLSDDVVAYASWSRGFATGDARSPRSCNRSLRIERAFSRVPQDPCSLAPEYDEEKVVVWEGGIKSSWLDERLRLNLAYYRTRWDDIQVVSSGARHGMLSRVLFNGGKATIQGFELEAIGRPLPGLTIDVGLGTIDAEYDRYVVLDPDPRIPASPRLPDDELVGLLKRQTDRIAEDLSHLNFDHAPNIEFNVGAEYELDLAFGRLNTRADWNHRGRNYGGRENLRAYEQGKRGVLSARMTLQLADGKTEISLWGRNLLDRQYILAGTPDLDGAFGSEAIQYAEPRRFGIELTRRFTID